MPVTIRTLPIVVHGRILVASPGGAGPWPVLVGFHGYGEAAERQLEAMRRVSEGQAWLLVSVQAPHPFYTKTQEVVAGWMTRQDRDLAIADNIRYVADAMTTVRAEWPTTATTVVTGFSQGVAMAWRAAAYAVRPTAGLIALAGDVPPEVAGDPTLSLPPALLGRGTRDRWYTAAKMEADRAHLASRGVRVEVCAFEGGHEWAAEFVAAAGRFLLSVG